MAKVIFYIVEIFDYASDQPIITEEDILNAGRFLSLIHISEPTRL